MKQSEPIRESAPARPIPNAIRSARGGWLSPNPAKRRMERLVLAYSPVWMAAVLLTMVSGVLKGWSETSHLCFGVGLALPLWLLPLAFPFGAEQSLPRAARYSVRFNVLIALFVGIQTWIGSELFFRTLGMEYHFNVRFALNGTPVFLYFMTIAYFSTYYVLMSLAWRAIVTRIPNAPRPALIAVRAVLAYAVAFGETYFMANDLMKQYFFYRDPRFALLFGSICYGTLFFVTFPFFHALDEAPAGPRPPLRALLREALAVNMIALMCYWGYGAVMGAR